MEVKLPGMNPHKKLLQEFMSGRITQEEFHMALYTSILKDESAFQELRYHQIPPKPEGLIRDETAFNRSIASLEGEDRDKKKTEFFKAAHEKYRAYYESFGKATAMNRCNLQFLREMFKFMSDRNEAYAFKVREIIYTYGHEKVGLQTV